MLNIHKKLKVINDMLKNSNFSTKVEIYFSTKVVGEDFNPYERNYTFNNLNPITIKAYVREVSPEALVYKQYGLAELGAKEILTEKRYIEYFRQANLIKIDGDEYIVYKEGTGNRLMISERPFNLIRVVVSKK
jgi:hypothetical protein